MNDLTIGLIALSFIIGIITSMSFFENNNKLLKGHVIFGILGIAFTLPFGFLFVLIEIIFYSKLTAWFRKPFFKG